MPSTGAGPTMQILNGSESGGATDVVGKLFLDRRVASTTLRYADARRTMAGSDTDRRLTAEREAQIRQRVLDGTYNSPSFADELARRIIHSGDL